MDVNSQRYQPVFRAMAAADDDQVGMARIAHMLTAAEALGFALVPVEATDEMIRTPGRWADWIDAGDKARIWSAMVAARPL